MNKRNKLLVFISIFLLFGFYFLYSGYSYLREVKLSNDLLDKEVTRCEEILQKESSSERAYCEKIIKENSIDNLSENFYVSFQEIIIFNLNAISVMTCFAIIVLSLLQVSKILKTKMFLNYLNRESYLKFIISIIKEAYKSVFPILFSLIILIIYLRLNTNVFINAEVINSIIWSKNLVSNNVPFIVIYLIKVLIYLAIYVNISLLVVRKNNNYLIAIISSLLTIIGMQLFLEIFIQKLLFKITNINFLGTFNILNIFSFNEDFGLIGTFLFPILFYLLSWILLILFYKDKEKLIVDCESKD